MFKFVLLIAVLFAGAACDENSCKKCFANLDPFKCSMLQEVQTCLAKDANCDRVSDDIGFACSDNYASFYYVQSGSGVDVYNSYMGIGDRSTWNLPDHCLHDHCTDFRRSVLMDLWAFLPIDKIELRLEDQETGSTSKLIFNGRYSVNDNWFSFDRLVSSPWDDLTKDNSYFFSIEGFAGVRRFYIAKKHSACCAESGWLSVVEGQKWCDYAKANSYPKVLFSGLAGATRWSKEYKVSSEMEIAVKLLQ